MSKDINNLRDITKAWPQRLAKVRASQVRTNTAGMSRPPRDPDEREFLGKRGQLGPFKEKKRV